MNNLTAANLAKLSGLSLSTIQNIESGRKKDLTVTELVAFAKALRVSPEQIAPILGEVLSLDAQRRQIRSETYVEAIATLAEKAGQT